MKSDKIVWGLVLLFVGVILLLDNFGVIDFYWGSVWRLWPLLLIIWGVQLLFSGKKYASGPWIVAGITLAILIFAGLYGATHVPEDSRWMKNFEWRGPERHRPAPFKINRFSEPYTSSIHRAELNIEGGATKYQLEDSTANLFEAEVRHRFVKYSLTRTMRDSVEVLSLRVPDSVQIRGPQNFDMNKVEMRLNTGPLWDVNLKMGAGKADFDLSKFKIAALKIEGGAASFHIKLGEKQLSSNVFVHTGVSEVNISVPASAGCRIKVDSGLSSTTFDGFDKQENGTYITSNYKSASKKIQINLAGGVSDFEVNRY